MSAEASGSAEGEDLDFEGGLTAPHRSRLHRLQGHRLRSRPDDLRLRQVGAGTGPAAGRRRKRRHHRLPEGGRRDQVQPVRRTTRQRRQRRRRRHLDHQGQRRPRRLRRDRRADPADRRPGLQLAARSRRAAAAERTRRSQGRTLQGDQEAAHRTLRRRRRHRPQDGGRTDDSSRRSGQDEKVELELELTLSRGQRRTELLRRPPTRSRWKPCSRSSASTRSNSLESASKGGIGGLLERSRRRDLGGVLLRRAPNAGEATQRPQGIRANACRKAETTAELQKCASLLK